MMNQTPSSERTCIAFFGCRNAGKSSLVNALTGQSLSVVSPHAGTTTDPVYKTMELLPLGPVVIIDTPGADDTGDLGNLRVEKTQEVLRRADIAVLVVDSAAGIGEADRELIEEFAERKIPYLLVVNKVDLTPSPLKDAIPVSAKTGEGVNALKERIAALANASERPARRLVADFLNPGDLIVLVIPIDEAAPKGRLILPQQQVIRDALEAGAIPVVCRDTELAQVLGTSTDNAGPAGGVPHAEAAGPGMLRRPPALVVTDSQAFHSVARIVPEDVPLTSFSILMARYKGFLDTSLAGIRRLSELRDGDRILIAEGCTHHRQCNDIGTVKIPRWLGEYVDVDFVIETVSGREFPEDLSRYRLVIHCGGCMLNEREVQSRMQIAVRQKVPFLNYGVLIAEMNGILERSIRPLGE